MSGKILNFETPKKVRSTEKHNQMFQSDSGIAGTYVSNMSAEDLGVWKAKHVKGKDERIEIRKTINAVQLVIIVYKKSTITKSKNWRDRTKDHNDVRMSMNGKLDMTYDEYYDMNEAIREATVILL